MIDWLNQLPDGVWRILDALLAVGIFVAGQAWGHNRTLAGERRREWNEATQPLRDYLNTELLNPMPFTHGEPDRLVLARATDVMTEEEARRFAYAWRLVRIICNKAGEKNSYGEIVYDEKYRDELVGAGANVLEIVKRR